MEAEGTELDQTPGQQAWDHKLRVHIAFYKPQHVLRPGLRPQQSCEYCTRMVIRPDASGRHRVGLAPRAMSMGSQALSPRAVYVPQHVLRPRLRPQQSCAKSTLKIIRPDANRRHRIESVLGVTSMGSQASSAFNSNIAQHTT